jgi:hypothetical protein
MKIPFFLNLTIMTFPKHPFPITFMGCSSGDRETQSERETEYTQPKT